MSLFEKLQKIQDEKKKEKEEPVVDLEQCECGSNIKGECEICDKIEDGHPLVEKIQKIGDEKQVNPPKPKNNASGTCPNCNKEFKHLSRHRCKIKPELVAPISKMSKEEKELLKAVMEENAKPEQEEQKYVTPKQLEKEKERKMEATKQLIAKQSKMEATKQITTNYDLFINAEIVYTTYTDLKIIRLCDLIAPMLKAIAKENQIAYWSLLDYEKGPVLLAEKLERFIVAGKLDCNVLVMNTQSKEGKVCLEVVQKHAGFIVRGVL